MATYWLTFRLYENGSYAKRYEDLMDAIRNHTSRWWTEPSSFLVFTSANDIDVIASEVKKAIDERVDLVVIGMPDYKAARLIGNNEDSDIFDFIPFMKRA